MKRGVPPSWYPGIPSGDALLAAATRANYAPKFSHLKRNSFSLHYLCRALRSIQAPQIFPHPVRARENIYGKKIRSR
jgi:hypothetical protein